MAGYAQEMMVKQFIGKVWTPKGGYMLVFTTGSPKFLLFAKMDATGTYETGLHIPIKKTDLKRDWRKNVVA